MTMIETIRPFNGKDRKMSAAVKGGPFRILAGLSLVLLLSACGSTRDGMTTGSVDDYRERHPIVIAEAEHTMDVPVAAGDRALTVSAREVVRGFARARSETSQGTVQILYPQGTPNSAAARGLRNQIYADLKRGGVDPRYIVEGSYPAAGGEAAPIRLSYVATTAMVSSQCGEWPKNIAPDMANRQYHNFGCAYQNNLAAQIANPSDLLGPRAMTPVDAESRANALNRYRTTATTISGISGF